MKTIIVLCGLAALAPQFAFGATGKPDFGNYVGSDTLNPAPKLPTTGPNSFLAITDVSAGFTHTAVTLNPTGGDDQSYAINIAGASLYGTAFGNCRVSDNGYVACQNNAVLSFFDNATLPDPRFGDRIVIAPYFDDLAPITGTSAIDVYTNATSAIVQWSNYTIVGKPTARLTFRVVFNFDAGNHGSVEFQYLEMSNGADGSSATIGIQRDNARAWNLYAFNTTGAVTMGSAGATALQAVLFGFDTDGDRLSDTFEAAIGTNSTMHDTDGGGLDDGAELAAGKDPTMSGDDGANTDTDSDGITDASEMFYGTDKTKVDTDGDSTTGTTLHDPDELYTRHTDPTKADTDGDGYADGVEVDAGTDPLDPTSFPSLDLKVSGTGKSSPRSAIDANGMMHIVAGSTSNNGFFYWMLDPSGAGKVKIPETFVKLPRGAVDPRVRLLSVHVFGGKVFVTYELVDKSGSTSVIAFVRINPANAPQDGNPVSATTIVEVSTFFAPTVGQPRQHDMQVDANGVHLAYLVNPTAKDRQQSRLGVGYALLSLDGVTQQQLTLPLPLKANNIGVHKRSAASLVMGADGTAHLLFLGTTKRGGQSSIVWSTINNGTVKTYDIPLATPMDYAGASIKGSLIYVFGSGAKSATAQLLVIDPANVTSAPVSGDFWLAPNKIDSASLLVSPSIMTAGGKGTNSASVTVFPNGTAIGYFSHGRNGTPNHDVCLAGFLNNGAPAAAPYCIPGASNTDGYDQNKHGARRLDINPLADGSLAFVYNSSGSSSLFFRRTSLAPFNFPATLPVINTPPRITTTPPTGTLRVGQAYSYAAMATDAETPNALTWSLISPPNGMTVSASGAVTWTPTAGQVGTQSPSLQVCDGGSPKRCVTQALPLTVAASGAPVIVSTPPTNAQANASYAYQLNVQDPQNNVTGYALTAPSPALGNMALSSGGLLTWTPTTKDAGSTLVTLTVTDSVGLTATQTFTILTTVPMSIDPVFTSVPSTTALVSTGYVYNATATDPGDAAATFTYSLTSTPVGNMTLSQSGALSWTPTSKEKGTQAITIQAASSTGRTATQSFAVTVIDQSGGGGCSCDIGGHANGLAWWMLAIVALALGFMRRRRA
jgi:MYXO-CTERM domain-containing protein